MANSFMHKGHLCSHKDERNFSHGRGDDGRLLWKCSICGVDFQWTERSSYWGNIECRRCGRAEMHGVFCSPECAAKFVPPEGE